MMQVFWEGSSEELQHHSDHHYQPSNHQSGTSFRRFYLRSSESNHFMCDLSQSSYDAHNTKYQPVRAMDKYVY